MAEKKITNKFSLKLLSIIFAVIAWLIITYTVDPSIAYVIKNVPITFTGEDNLNDLGLTLLDRDDYDNINIKIRGPRSAVINTIDAVSARADISDITAAGQRTKNVDVSLGISGVSLANRARLSVIVNVDELIDKEVPIKIIQSGTEKNKQTIIFSESENETILLRGAKTELNKVDYALVSVDISTIDADTSRPLSYALMSADDSRINCRTLIDAPKSVDVISKVCLRKTVSVVPVLPEQFKNSLSLSAKSLSKDKIDIGIIDENIDIDKVYAEFDPSDYSGERDEYTLTIKAPDGVYISESSRTITAKVTIENKLSRQMTLDIELRNAPKGASLAQNSISLLLSGTGTALSNDNVKAYVDASGLDSGYHELEIKLETTADITLAEPASVGVNIE